MHDDTGARPCAFHDFKGPANQLAPTVFVDTGSGWTDIVILIRRRIMQRGLMIDNVRSDGSLSL